MLTKRVVIITTISVLVSLVLTHAFVTFLMDGAGGRLSLVPGLIIPLIIAPVASIWIQKINDRAAALEQEKLEHASKLALLGEMTASIVHEINQPLSAVKLVAQGLQRRSSADAERTLEQLPAKLDKIVRQIDRVTEICALIRKSSRIDSESNLSASVKTVIHDSFELIGPQLKAAKIEFSAIIEDELPTAAIHPGKLEQVMLNLTTNARDALLASSQPSLWIKVEAYYDGSIVIKFEDSAGGIPPQALVKIFDSFFTTKPAGEGTGIGLSLSKNFIETAGGAIEVCNTSNGALFTIRIPANAKPQHGAQNLAERL